MLQPPGRSARLAHPGPGDSSRALDLRPEGSGRTATRDRRSDDAPSRWGPRSSRMRPRRAGGAAAAPLAQCRGPPTTPLQSCSRAQPFSYRDPPRRRSGRPTIRVQRGGSRRGIGRHHRGERRARRRRRAGHHRRGVRSGRRTRLRRESTASSVREEQRDGPGKPHTTRGRLLTRRSDPSGLRRHRGGKRTRCPLSMATRCLLVTPFEGCEGSPIRRIRSRETEPPSRKQRRPRMALSGAVGCARRPGRRRGLPRPDRPFPSLVGSGLTAGNPLSGDGPRAGA